MKYQRSSVQAVMASALMLGLASLTNPAAAADKPEMEKCYGVVKAGKNDCKTATNSCVGHAEKDADPSAFLVVPKGTCEKLVGGSLKPKA